jgi:hypothetical protein
MRNATRSPAATSKSIVFQTSVLYARMRRLPRRDLVRDRVAEQQRGKSLAVERDEHFPLLDVTFFPARERNRRGGHGGQVLATAVCAVLE